MKSRILFIAIRLESIFICSFTKANINAQRQLDLSQYNKVVWNDEFTILN